MRLTQGHKLEFNNLEMTMTPLIRVFLVGTLLQGSLFSVASGESPATAPSDLPKVVLIGDSIRLSYAATVTKQLEGKAVIVSPGANGGDSANVLRNLEKWAIQEKPAVVHFNCGIHDTKKFQATGKFQVSPEDYAANLRQIVERIREETGAEVLFATSTPILDDRAAAARKGRDYELLESSIEQYNHIATKLMAELKVPVNDLHAVIAKPEPPMTTEMLIVGDGVHMTPPARELLGKQVAEFISAHLPKQSDK